MATNTVVVDTNVWSHLYGFKTVADPQTEAWRVSLLGKTVAIAVQTRAEVLGWTLQRNLGERRATAITSLLDATPTVPVDEAVVQSFVRLVASCRRSGHALGDKAHTADAWIAATALTVEAPLLSADGIFRNAPRLELLA
jgi:predicted nucleic acid-binding protein